MVFGNLESIRPMSLENLLRTRPAKQRNRGQSVSCTGRLVENNLETRLTNGVDIKEVKSCADDSFKHAVVQMLS